MPLPIKKYYLLFICLILPLTCLAGTMGQVGEFKPWSVLLQGGFLGYSSGKAQHVDIEQLIGNQYTVDNNSQISGLAGLGVYFNRNSQDFFQLSYGLNLFYLGQTTIRGDIVEENLFTNNSYQYHIQNVPVFIAARTLFNINNTPFNLVLDAGIGPNFMRTSDYREIPLVDFSEPDRAFSGTSSTAFSATAGIGLRLNHILGSRPVDCGYRFFYLGKGNLRRENNLYLNTLNTGNTYANALLCAVTI
jgi:hypothetical protein